MKLKIALVLFIAIGSLCAQTKFEKGYFITTKGDKVNCLIKNEDWVNIPEKIEYKQHENNQINTIKEQSLNSVFIEGKLLLERHNVLIDRYSKNLDKLATSRISNYKNEDLLLKVVVNGKVKLLKYVSDGVQYFFYELNSKVLPLEYKWYKTPKGILGKNLNYQKLLKEELNCSDSNLSHKIKYKEKPLVKYFIQYNSCNGETTNQVYSQEIKKGKFNIWAKISIGQSKSDNPYTNISSLSFEKKTVFKYGVEIEYTLPFLNNKWSLFLEPTYQSYSSKTKSVTQAGDFSYHVDYSSIELPLGIRRSFFLNEKNKVFANAGVTFDQVLNDEFHFAGEYPLEIGTTTNYFLGIGYNLHNKFSIEFRYNTSRDITRFEKVRTSTEFHNMSFKIGYNFL